MHLVRAYDHDGEWPKVGDRGVTGQLVVRKPHEDLAGSTADAEVAATRLGLGPITPANPYWAGHGTTFFLLGGDGPLGRDEIVFLSQIANHHHQVAFITGREKPESSNNVHHVAFRSRGTLDDLKALKKTLEADARVTQILPLTHGNAWSVYFRDPEGNQIEMFCDTPWYVPQPLGFKTDLNKTEDELFPEVLGRAHPWPQERQQVLEVDDLCDAKAGE